MGRSGTRTMAPPYLPLRLGDPRYNWWNADSGVTFPHIEKWVVDVISEGCAEVFVFRCMRTSPREYDVSVRPVV